MRKSDRTRPYPPEFVGLETLAYLMDCATSTIEKYVSDGLLPASTPIGKLSRWHWPTIRDMFIGINKEGAENGEAIATSQNPSEDRAKRYAQTVAAKIQK